MKASCSALARSAGTPGGATNGSDMKNGISAKSISASMSGSLVSSRPVGTSGKSGWRLVRPNTTGTLNARFSHMARWPVFTELMPTNCPSISLRCMARNIGAAPV